MLIGIIFAFSSALCFGISNVYWKFAAKDDEFSRIVFFRGTITVTLFGLVWIIAKNTGIFATTIIHTEHEVENYLITIGICTFCSLGLVFYLLSIKTVPVSIGVALSSINIFSIITAIIVLHEAFKNVYLISFSLAALGVWWMSAEKNKTIWLWNKGATYALLAAFFWGVSYALFKFPAKWVGAIPLSFILECCVLITAFIWNSFTATTSEKIFSNFKLIRIRHYSILAALLFGGTLFFNLAIQKIDVLLLNVTGNFTLVCSAVISVIWQKEKISKMQFLGLLLILASLMLVQIL